MPVIDRRDFLKASAALGLAALPMPSRGAAAHAPLKTLGEPRPFDYAWLKGQARALAT